MFLGKVDEPVRDSSRYRDVERILLLHLSEAISSLSGVNRFARAKLVA